MTFWVVMTVLGLVEVVACGVLAARARRAGRPELRRRYVRGMYAFVIWTGLSFARVLLLHGGG